MVQQTLPEPFSVSGTIDVGEHMPHVGVRIGEGAMNLLHPDTAEALGLELVHEARRARGRDLNRHPYLVENDVPLTGFDQHLQTRWNEGYRFLSMAPNARGGGLYIVVWARRTGGMV